jgi:hypothetical protein
MTSFHVGQVVVCIDDRDIRWPGGEEIGERYPVEGGVYTVRMVRFCRDSAGLLLHEIVNPICEWYDGGVGELGFHVDRFRPAKTTSLEVFEGMLAPDLETAK